MAIYLEFYAAIFTKKLKTTMKIAKLHCEFCPGATSLDMLATPCLSQPRLPFSFPGHSAASWLFLPRCRTVHFPLLNSMRFLFHFSSPSRSSWMAAQPLGTAQPPPGFLSTEYLLSHHPDETIKLHTAFPQMMISLTECSIGTTQMDRFNLTFG